MKKKCETNETKRKLEITLSHTLSQIQQIDFQKIKITLGQMRQMGQNFHCIAGRKIFIPTKKVRNVKIQRYGNEKPVIYTL